MASTQQLKIVIAGNKCDMESDRAVTTEQGRVKAQQYGCPFMECSAKANINIEKIFEKSLEQLFSLNDSGDKNSGKGKDSSKKRDNKDDKKGSKKDDKKGKAKDDEESEICCNIE
jgi:GTPase SAR1 family protein